MRKQSPIIEACHMPGTVVGCHLLCLDSCLARGVVLLLFVQTYHWLLSAVWHFYNQCLFNSLRQVIWLECESKFWHSPNIWRRLYPLTRRFAEVNGVVWEAALPCRIHSKRSIRTHQHSHSTSTSCGVCNGMACCLMTCGHAYTISSWYSIHETWFVSMPIWYTHETWFAGMPK